MDRKRKSKEVSKLSTGNTLFDNISGGGFGAGKVINIVGDNSTGKTLLAIEFINSARKALGSKLKWFYDDGEAGLSFDTEELYGLELVPEDQKSSTTVQELEYNLHNQLKVLKKDEYLIYVLDSLDALSSDTEQDRSAERIKATENNKALSSGTYALDKQKFLGEFFRLRVNEIKDKKCILLIVSQVRENIGVVYGKKYKRMGGKALDFYASQIWWLAVVEKELKKGVPVGVTIKASNSKNKTGKPFREGFINILFDYGVDDISTNIDYYYGLKTDLGKLKKTEAKKLTWADQEFTRESLIHHIEAEGEEMALRLAVNQKYQAFEDSISSGRKKRV